MNVVYIAKAIAPSRTANSIHIMKMCQAMARNGHKVTLCILTEGKVEEASVNLFKYYGVEENFTIISVPVFATKLSRIRYLLSIAMAAFSIVFQITKLKPDLVFGRDLLGCAVAAFLRKKVIYESHFPVWHGRLEGLLFKQLIKQSHFYKLVVISEALKKAYLDYYDDLSAGQVFVAHDGADSVTSWQQSVSRLWGHADTLKVGYVGHLYKGKGVEVIADVAPLLPDVDFHIIGGLEKDLGYWKGEIKLSNVYFYGFIQQTQLADYIMGLDICLLPNQRHVSAYGATEGKQKNISTFTSPLKMFEYMAYKKPIIASDLPVLREVLDDSCAKLVPPEDSLAWVRAINQLRDKVLRDQLANTANELFMKKYTWQDRARAILATVE
jgi:glycosyltransferase involved in cell wall biosynthesis